jgi:hypothetical protein
MLHRLRQFGSHYEYIYSNIYSRIFYSRIIYIFSYIYSNNSLASSYGGTSDERMGWHAQKNVQAEYDMDEN